MRRQRRSLLRGVLALTTLLAFAGETRASGYYGGPLGAKALGRGGAFVALADDLTAAVYNPGALSRTSTSLRLHVENKLSASSLTFARAPTRDGRSESSPIVEFEPSTNERPWSLLSPFLGVQSSLGLRNWTFALVSYTPSGGNASYPLDGGQKYLLVQRESVVINTTLAAAWRPHPDWAVGIGVQALSVPSIQYQLVIDNTPGNGFDVYNPASSALDMLTTLRGSDPFTLQLSVGAWGRLHRNLEAGLSGQVLPNNITAKGTIHVEPVAPSTLELLANQDPPISPGSAVQTTRNGIPANDIRLDLPLPLTFRGGTRYIHRAADGAEHFDVELDVTYETWSRVKTLSMDGSGIEARFASVGTQPIPLGVIRVPKRWQDTLTVALGGDLRPLAYPVAFRLGTYVESPVARPKYAHVDFPIGAHLGATTGLSFSPGSFVVHLGYEYRHMLPFTVSEEGGAVYQIKPNLGENPPPAAAPPVVNAGAYTSHSHQLALAVSWTLP
jgi:long-chain fatty acid transport protein